MNEEEDIEIVLNFINCIRFNEKPRYSIKQWLEATENLIQKYRFKRKQLNDAFNRGFIHKSVIEEEIKKAEKENEPCEKYGKESRNYWINTGKINLGRKLLKGDNNE